jgi:hypothetical protein
MKKAKVDKLIQKFKAEAHRAGREQGKREERARYEETIFAPSRDGMIWLGNQPPTRDYYTIAMPGGYMTSVAQFDPNSSYRPYDLSATRVDFKLKQKGIAFANGVSVRWADWEPMGPYPVVDFAEPPRRW